MSFSDDIFIISCTSSLKFYCIVKRVGSVVPFQDMTVHRSKHCLFVLVLVHHIAGSSQASTGFEINSAPISRPRSPRSFHRHLCEQNLSESIILPSEPPGKCSAHLQSLISDFMDKARRGANLGQYKTSYLNMPCLLFLS